MAQVGDEILVSSSCHCNFMKPCGKCEGFVLIRL